jgi:hypothetical protein
MRRSSMVVTGLLGCLLITVVAVTACSSPTPNSGFGSSSGGASSGGAGSGGASSGGAGSGGAGGSSGGSGGVGSFGDGGKTGGGGGDGGVACPAGLQCNVQCSGGSTTTITGKVYDPAGRNPLYDVAVYVPAVPLVPLPKGVPTGADACSCAALFKSGAVVNTTTKVDGTFTLSNAPVGSDVPLVIQIGKWRRQFKVSVSSCQANAVPDKTLLMPNSVVGSTTDNMPDIAVSTGFADSLECLMTRIGLPPTEYVAGNGGSGHVHIFSGGDPSGGGGGIGGGGGPGRPETPSMPGAPVSSTSLWQSSDQLMPYDIVLLSCEGGETYNANPAALEQYLNAGGRAFGSHFHYAWFSGPISSGQSYSAPADWGTNLATWSAGTGQNQGPIGGTIDTTLNGSGAPFPKGQALQQWLTLVNALGQNGVGNGLLSIFQPRYNSVVASANKPSQPWITDSSANQTMYFSFDTPVNAPPAADGGAPNYCGRAVFSDLHVAGDPSTGDSTPPPGGCANGPLSPQEKALEFMLFDLSSCVIPDTIAPPDAGVPAQ